MTTKMTQIQITSAATLTPVLTISSTIKTAMASVGTRTRVPTTPQMTGTVMACVRQSVLVTAKSLENA